MIDVAIPFAPYGHEWPGGTNYMRSLVSAAAGSATPDIRLHVFLGRHAKPFALPDGVVEHRTAIFDRHSTAWYCDKISGRIAGRSLMMNALYKAVGIDVVSHGFPTCRRRPSSIGWIPDFQHLHLPQLFSEQEHATRRRVLGRLARYSDLVVLSSQHALDDYRRFAPAFADKGRVLQFAALPPTPSATDSAPVLASHQIDQRYFYVPNQVWAHKNHGTLVEAVVIAARQRPSLLVISTGDTRDPRAPELYLTLQRRVAEAGIGRNLRFLGLVEYSQVGVLLRHAIAMINPSLFEGWSTTVEEAKTLGVPALLSDIPTHLEQQHPDADYFAPTDAARLAELLVQRHDRQAPRAADAEAQGRARHQAAVRRFGDTYIRIVREASAF